MARRWRYPRARRGDFFDVVPTPPPPATAGWVPGTVRATARPRCGQPSRGRYAEPAWPETPPPAAPDHLPGFVRQRTRRSAAAGSRGTFTVVPPSLPWTPSRTGRARPRPVAVRPTGRHEPPWAPGRPPPAITRRRGWAPSTRSAVRYEPPWIRPAPPASLRPRRRPWTLRAGCGRFHEPVWPQVAAESSVWRPGVVCARRRPSAAALPVRGRFAEPFWPAVAPAEGALYHAHRDTTTAVAATRVVATATDPTRSTAATGAADRSAASTGHADRTPPTMTAGG